MPDNYSPALSGAHAQKTTAALTSDVQTFAQAGRAFFIAVANQDVYLTVDGTVPSSTNGLLVPKGGLPVFFPISCSSIKVSPTAATAAVVDILWVVG